MMNATARCYLVFAAMAAANVRYEFPAEVPGPPAYAEISTVSPFGEAIIHTDEWAAIPFFRERWCVPADFKLLLYFDPNAEICPATVHGFEIWSAPPPGGQPVQVKASGNGGVPIYFVTWAELQAAVRDGELTIGELEALPSLLIGYAHSFTADAHPAMTAPAHRLIGPFQLSASGTLEDDGRSFQLQVATGGPAGPARHVKISFR